MWFLLHPSLCLYMDIHMKWEQLNQFMNHVTSAVGSNSSSKDNLLNGLNNCLKWVRNTVTTFYNVPNFTTLNTQMLEHDLRGKIRPCLSGADPGFSWGGRSSPTYRCCGWKLQGGKGSVWGEAATPSAPFIRQSLNC